MCAQQGQNKMITNHNSYEFVRSHGMISPCLEAAVAPPAAAPPGPPPASFSPGARRPASPSLLLSSSSPPPPPLLLHCCMQCQYHINIFGAGSGLLPLQHEQHALKSGLITPRQLHRLAVGQNRLHHLRQAGERHSRCARMHRSPPEEKRSSQRAGRLPPLCCGVRVSPPVSRRLGESDDTRISTTSHLLERLPVGAENGPPGALLRRVPVERDDVNLLAHLCKPGGWGFVWRGAGANAAGGARQRRAVPLAWCRKTRGPAAPGGQRW